MNKLGKERETQNAFYKSVISSLEEILRSRGLENELVTAFKIKSYAPVGDDPVSAESDGFIKGMMAAALSLNDSAIKDAIVRLAGFYVAAQRGRDGPAQAAMPSFKRFYEKVFNRGREIGPYEYAVNVAPWWEEMFFFALPMTASSFLLGLGSLWTILVMAVSRIVFYYLHPGARAHAPPAEYIAPLKVAVAGFAISFFPVASSMAFSGLSTVDGGLIPSFILYPSSLIAGSVFASMIVHYFANKVFVSGRRALPAISDGRDEGATASSGLNLIRARTISILADVPVIEEKYTPLSHFKTYIRELAEAWHGRQYHYIVADVLVILFQIRVPNAQWLYTEDGALEKIVIKSGGWSLSPVFGVLSLAAGFIWLNPYILLTSVAFIAVSGSDMLFDVLMAEAATSHEWLHAYQAKVAERARREGRIENTRDFLSDNMMALEMIYRFDHKEVTGDMLDEVKTFVESLIGKVSSKKSTEKNKPPDGKQGAEKGVPSTVIDPETVKEEIGGILSGLGYSSESVGKMPDELVLLGCEIKKEFPDLKAQISARDIKASRKALRDITFLLKARGYKDIAEPNNVTRYLVNALGEEDIFHAVDDAEDASRNDVKRAIDQLVTCTSIAQVMYIALKLLGVEDLGVLYAPEHIMLFTGTAPGNIFFIDPTMAEFREVETGKYYNAFTGTDYMGIRPEYLVNPPREAMILSHFYQCIRMASPQALMSSKYKNRGDVYAVAGKEDRAIEEYTKALELDPGDPDVHNNLGNIYFANGDYPGSLAEYNTALKLNPASGYAYLNRGNVFMKLGEPEKAADDYKSAMKYMGTPDEGEEKLDEAFAAIRAKNALKDPERTVRQTSTVITVGDLTIEDPVPGDAPAIKELSKEIFDDYAAITVPDIVKAMDEAKPDIPISYIKVCRAEGKVVGYILAKANFAAELLDPGTREMWLNIRQIAVHKDFRGQGIGGILCDHVMELARSDGYGVFCMTTSSEYSVRIAERRGFVRDELFGMYVRRASGSEPVPEAPSTGIFSPQLKRLMLRAKYVIPSLVNSLISVSMKNEKTVLAIDLGLGEGEVNAMIKELAEVLTSLGVDNADLKRFLGNLVIIKGEGTALAARIRNLTDPEKGSVKPENVIVVTKNDNMGLYGSVEGRGVIAAIEDGGFSRTAYLPLFEIMLFAVGKNLGWDEKTLKKHYAMIPNVMSSEKLSPEEIAALFGPDGKTLVIRLIPDAVEFDDKEFGEIIRGLKVMLARA